MLISDFQALFVLNLSTTGDYFISHIETYYLSNESNIGNNNQITRGKNNNCLVRKQSEQKGKH